MLRGVEAMLLIALMLAPAWSAAADNDDELGKRYYRLGETLYNRSDFAGALTQFKRSYEHSKKPALLFNIARCHESLGQHAQAIAAYEEYLQHKPRGADNIRFRIKNLRRLMQERGAKQPASSPPSPGPQPAPGADPAASAPVDPAPGEETTTSDDPGAADEDAPVRSRPLRLTGWILAGAGVALLATGVATGLVARSKQDELEQANREGQEYAQVKQIEDQGQTMNAVSIVGYALGSAAAVAGAVLVMLDWRAERRVSRAWLTPVVAASGGGVSAGWRF